MLRAKVFVLLMVLLFVWLSPPCWASNLDIPVVVDYGNAITPIVGSHGGYNWLGPELVVVSVPFAKGTVQPGIPLKAAGFKQCPTCGSLDIQRGALIDGGGYGDYCEHCKKSLFKMYKEMHEEKVHKLFALVSIDDIRGWTALASNTQLLLYRKSMVPAEKYQEFIEKALNIFQMFQSASQNLNEHA